MPDKIELLNVLLLKSTKNGDIRRAELAIKNGANTNCCDEYGARPFLIAVQKIDHDMVNLLLKYHADPRAFGKDGMYAMAISTIRQDAKMIDAIGAHCWDAEAPASGMSSPLEIAIGINSFSIADHLINHGASFQETSDTSDCNNMLEIAYNLQNKKAFSYILKNGGFWFDTTKDGPTLFEIIVKDKKWDFLELLKKHAEDEPLIEPEKEENTININKENGLLESLKSFKITKWIQSIKPQNRRLKENTRLIIGKLKDGSIKELIEIGEDTPFIINARDGSGVPISHLLIRHAESVIKKIPKEEIKELESASKKLEGYLEKLYKLGINYNSRDPKTGNTIAHELMNSSFGKVFLNLYDKNLYKTLINRSNQNLDRLLHIAVQKNDYIAVDGLLSRGCDKNPVNKEGYTPLHLCAVNLNSELAVKLIKNGCNLNIKTRQGKDMVDLVKGDVEASKKFKLLISDRRNLQKSMGIFSHNNPMAILSKIHHKII